MSGVAGDPAGDDPRPASLVDQAGERLVALHGGVVDGQRPEVVEATAAGGEA
ncbi:hypothetical protein ACFV1W_10900 [Kitasatospora sp. NPDC059648]|uniref:hypothetical protein n=1 Tax=Kitasatospora sp. NPDC059648 TaxID=3346894 RepID=UPI00369C8537